MGNDHKNKRFEFEKLNQMKTPTITLTIAMLLMNVHDSSAV